MKTIKVLAYIMACLLLCIAWIISFVLGYFLQYTWECIPCIAVNFAVSVILARLVSNKDTEENKTEV